MFKFFYFSAKAITYNEKEFLSDKLSIVDIKAKDEAGYTYQIEIQILTYGTLSARMSYGLCDLYASQLEEGKGYDRLKPVISIWVLPRNILPDSSSFHHHFQLCSMMGLFFECT